jgi:phosphohistidine phosphatase SixA
VVVRDIEVPVIFRFALLALLLVSNPASAAEEAWTALKSGGIVLFRHAYAPGGGDPPGMRIGDCSTQRNLDETGRAQARRIGEAFRTQGVEIGAVMTSQWCRTKDTAELAFPGRAREEPAFNSFFNDRSRSAEQTQAALKILAGWKGPGALVVTTHQVNITALTGVVPGSGDGIVVRVTPQGATAIGTIRP